MRSLLVALALLVVTASVVEAKPKKRAALHKKKKKRVAKAKHKKLVLHGPITGQSVGAPWNGELRKPTKLPADELYKIRRPARAFGTRSTVELIRKVIIDLREQFPDGHIIAVGDLSAEGGGAITEHHSHQSGRDADIGLLFTEQPDGYPASFVDATETTLDAEQTMALVEGFAQTRSEDGGVQVMFLDYDVQGMLWRWAMDNGYDEDRLERLLQYPNRGASGALVRHEPNHANHLHVRFKCPRADSACR